MEIERGSIGRYPFAALGRGEPLILLAGLAPVTGFEGDGMVRATAGSLLALAGTRRLVLLNRRPHLPRGMTMAELAAEHAEALHEGFGGPVDVIGTSTGGSIAQQLAADHPGTVRRLVLLSTACRLGPEGKRMQRAVAARLRAGATRQALAVLAAGLVPPRRGRLAAAAVAWLAGPRIVDDAQGIEDMATTLEAEDPFDLAALPAIAAPAAIVAGRDDRFYSPALFEETARLIPGSELHVLPGRGHITVLRDPRALAAIRALLER